MNNININSWTDFVSTTEVLDSNQHVFRGQSNSQWALRPSLLRLLLGKISLEKALEYEKYLINTFQSQAHLYLPSSLISDINDKISWLMLMQHHGVPTRLLDWTKSIYVAAYFAINENLDCDGSIWFLNPDYVNENLYSKNSKLTGEHKLSLQDKYYFDESSPHNLHFIKKLKMSDRMITQQGLFSCPLNMHIAHEKLLAGIFKKDRHKNDYGKIIIPAHLKQEFGRKLLSMNITANSLFPGIDGLGKSISEELLFNI